jgi:Transposase IS116/IS110/IS902 family
MTFVVHMLRPGLLSVTQQWFAGTRVLHLLLSLKGVDIYTELLKSEVGPIERCADCKRLVSWAGLAPSVY